MGDNFEYAVEELLKDEGGYVNDPVDPGGETKYGITKMSYPSVDIKSLTVAEAKEIYRRDYWDRYGYWRIQHKELAAKMLSICVNLPPKKAHKLIQWACYSCGSNIEIDGYLGTKSFVAINSLDAAQLLVAFRSEVAGYYRVKVAEKPFKIKYIKGWLNRAYK